MALSTVFHSINSPENSPLSHSVLPVEDTVEHREQITFSDQISRKKRLEVVVVVVVVVIG